jgi:hypothetical protein
MRAGIFILFIWVHGAALAQSSCEPLNRDFSNPYERYLNNKNSNTHTALKPYLHSELGSLGDSVLTSVNMPFFNRKDSAGAEKKASHFSISPAFVLEPGFSLTESKAVFETAGGLRMNGNLKKSIAWDVVWLAGRSSFANYIDTFATYTHTIPGMGYAYKNGRNFDYQYIAGYLSWSPNRFFNFQAGRDKHFWGDGYRSLFLSDVSNAYPFAKVTATVWKLKYAAMYAMHQDLSAGTGYRADAKNKFATFHYLSWNIWKRVNLGLFESIVWQGTDTSRTRSYDINYMNPVIFFRPVEYSLGSADNALLGGSFKVKVAKKQQFYGQLILDEFFLKQILARSGWWANKQGLQLGFRSFDIFKVKGLDVLTELNVVKPYTYTHGSVQQNYGHFNLPLAHPLGANFKEFTGITTYQVKNWLFEGKIIYGMFGADTSGTNYGSNIFKSYITREQEFGNYIGQGVRTEHIYLGLRAAYLITRHGNMEANGGIIMRGEMNPGDNLYTVLFYVGIRTALWNVYRDY